MCDFCDYQENLIEGSMDLDGPVDSLPADSPTALHIEELKSPNGGVEYRLCVYFNGHHAYSVPVDYCPVCGRAL